MNLYRLESSSNPKHDAQRNLQERTHYVDDDTLRFHKARILSTRVCAGGLLYALIESVALDPDNRRRGYRYVIFDVFGTVHSRVDLAHCFNRPEQARKALAVELGKLDAKAITLTGIEREAKSYYNELERLRVQVLGLDAVKV